MEPTEKYKVSALDTLWVVCDVGEGVRCRDTAALNSTCQNGNRQHSWGLPLHHTVTKYSKSLFYRPRSGAVCLTRPVSLSSNLFIATQHVKSHWMSFFSLFFFWADPRAAPVVHLIPFVWWHKRSRGRAHNNMEKVEDTLHRKGVIAGCNGSVQVENGKY